MSAWSDELKNDIQIDREWLSKKNFQPRYWAQLKSFHRIRITITRPDCFLMRAIKHEKHFQGLLIISSTTTSSCCCIILPFEMIHPVSFCCSKFANNLEVFALKFMRLKASARDKRVRSLFGHPNWRCALYSDDCLSLDNLSLLATVCLGIDRSELSTSVL